MPTESPPLELSREEMPGETEREASLPPCKKKKGLSAILQHIEEENKLTAGNTSSTPEDKVENELTSYLDYPKMSPDTDPLEWWKNEQRRFPTLSVLARKYLCVCVWYQRTL